MAVCTSITTSVVPWHNPNHFIKVYKCLFSNEIVNKRWAIDEISVWETKCHPSLPSAIEATFLLTNAVIQDILWNNSTGLIHHSDLQAIYGSAITRFVSLSVDNNRNDGFRFNSTAQIAKSIGIPSFIIDVRNEWCHSSRPSLSVLRLATQSALDYLKKCYWDEEVAQVKAYVKQPPYEGTLFILFKEFIKFYEDVCNGIKTKIRKFEDGTEVDHEYTVILKNLEKYLKKDERLFVKVLVSNGIFIPTDEEFKHMVSEEEYRFFATELNLEEEDAKSGDEKKNTNDEKKDTGDEKMDTDDITQSLEFERENFPELPQHHENLWEPVIRLLNKYDAVPLFMEDLLISQGDRTIIGQKLLIGWILKILRIHCTEFTVKSRRLKKIFRNKGIVPNWNSMLHSAVVNPCKYALFVLPLILSNVTFEDDVKHRIVGLVSIKLGFTAKVATPNNFFKLYYTVEDLKKTMDRNRKDKKVKSPHSVWSPCPDKCHKLWPIGYIVNEVDSEKREEVESIFEPVKIFKSEFKERMLPSNKNEDDDDDHYTSQGNKRPDLDTMMFEIKKKKSVKLWRSD